MTGKQSGVGKTGHGAGAKGVNLKEADVNKADSHRIRVMCRWMVACVVAIGGRDQAVCAPPKSKRKRHMRGVVMQPFGDEAVASPGLQIVESMDPPRALGCT
jgi:hypothetical protein